MQGFVFLYFTSMFVAFDFDGQGRFLQTRLVRLAREIPGIAGSSGDSYIPRSQVENHQAEDAPTCDAFLTQAVSQLLAVGT